MAYATGAFPVSAPARPTLRPHLTEVGYELVTQDYAYDHSGVASTLDVYRSPAASNIEGKDFFIAVREYVASGTRALVFEPVEVWDATAKTGVRYSPVSNNVTPAADFSVGSTPAGPASFAGFAVGWPDVNGSNFILTMDINRFILALGIPGATTTPAYVGLLDRMHPTSVDGLPLVAMRIDTGTSSNVGSYGYATREPGQSGANTFNFRVQLYGTTGIDRLFMSTSYAAAEGISGRQVLSPCVVHASRLVPTTARGLLRGPKMGTASTGQTDTLTETALDGTTRAYYCVYPNVGLFVPQF